MAIPFLNHLDLRSVSQLQNAILHKTTSGNASNVEGKIIYDTGSDTIKYYNGSAWINLDGSGTEYDLVVPSGTTAIRLEGVTESGNTNDDITITGGNNVTVTRTSATELTIASTDTNTNQLTEWVLRDDDNDDVTIDHNTFVKFVAATGTLGTNTSGSGTTSDPYVVTITSPDTNTQRAAGTGLSLSGNTINANVGATGTTQAPQSITTTANRLYQVETDDQDNLVVNVPWVDTNTNTDTLQSIADSSSSSEQFVTFVANASGAQTGLSDAAFKYIPSTGTLKVTNLIVSGDTTTANETVKVVENNTLQFEGAAGSNADTELNFTTATLTGGDKTVTLKNESGTIALLSDITGTNSGTNTGDEPDATTSVKGIVELATNAEANAGTPTARAVTPANLQAYTGASTIATVGTITTGVWQGTEISTTYIANTSGTNTGDEPNSSTSVRGIVELATTTEASAGTDSQRAVTPAGVKQFDDDRKHVSNITAAISAGATHTITHNLGTKDLIVQIYALVSDLTTSGTNIVDQYAEVKLDVIRATDNTITIAPNIAIRALAGGTLRVLIKALSL
jgi:hypothetical protein